MSLLGYVMLTSAVLNNTSASEVLVDALRFAAQQIQEHAKDTGKINTNAFHEKAKVALEKTEHMPLHEVPSVLSLHEMRLLIQTLDQSFRENAHDLSRVPYDYVLRWVERLLEEAKVIHC